MNAIEVDSDNETKVERLEYECKKTDESSSELNLPPDDVEEEFSIEYKFSDFLKRSPNDPELKCLETKLEFKIGGLSHPIGTCVLPSENIVISVTGEDAVRIFSPQGKPLHQVEPGRPFRRPSDLVVLPGGRFAVRDDLGIQLFSEEGIFMHHVCPGFLGRCYGLTTDGRGHLITINTNAGKTINPRNPTLPGKMDALLININSNEITKRYELELVIGPKSLDRSKCRFLACNGQKVMIVDLGLDCIYVLDIAKEDARYFGKTGKGNGEFSDPAGIAVDRRGYMIVADANNDRLQIFDRKRKFVGIVKTAGQRLRRPSAVYFDAFEPALLVLNLKSNCLLKFSLVK